VRVCSFCDRLWIKDKKDMMVLNSKKNKTFLINLIFNFFCYCYENRKMRMYFGILLLSPILEKFGLYTNINKICISDLFLS